MKNQPPAKSKPAHFTNTPFLSQYTFLPFCKDHKIAKKHVYSNRVIFAQCRRSKWKERGLRSLDFQRARPKADCWPSKSIEDEPLEGTSLIKLGLNDHICIAF